jgi:hypothetical protein
MKTFLALFLAVLMPAPAKAFVSNPYDTNSTPNADLHVFSLNVLTNAIPNNGGGAILLGGGNLMTNTAPFQSTQIGGDVILGGTNNSIYEGQTTGISYDLIAMGRQCLISNAGQSAIVSGYHNAIMKPAVGSFIGGGQYNSNNAPWSVLVGGAGNSINTSNTTWLGTGNGSFSFLGGGANNSIMGPYAFLGGGAQNSAQGFASVLVGGNNNVVSSNGPPINYAYGPFSAGFDAVIVGGGYNCTFGPVSTIVGGGENTNYAPGAVIVGGDRCLIDDTNSLSAVIGGGQFNYIHNGIAAIISGGYYNSISNGQSTVIAGGADNAILGNNVNGFGADNSAIGGGIYNIISNSAHYATIPGGESNLVSGHYSLAAGLQSTANYPGSFVWSDSYGGESDTSSNQFRASAHGGFFFDNGPINGNGAGLTGVNAATNWVGRIVTNTFNFGIVFTNPASQTVFIIKTNGGIIEGSPLGSFATGVSSHTEGQGGTASGIFSHAEGSASVANGPFAHAEGNGTEASGLQSHAEGLNNTASGDNSHAEGSATLASTDDTHAEGTSTIASSSSSHAEGSATTASGSYSHSEGDGTIASGESSHSEGAGTVASGFVSSASGYNSAATNANSFVWSAGPAVIGSITSDTYTVYAPNGIRLLGPTSGNGSGLTNLTSVIKRGTTNAITLTSFTAIFPGTAFPDTNYTAVAIGNGFALAGSYVSNKTTTNCVFNMTVATGSIDWMAIHP